MCATTARNTGTGNRNVPLPQTSQTPRVLAHTSRPIEKYVSQNDFLLNSQIDLFLQHVAYFENSFVCSKGVKGSLARNIQYWQNIGASDFIIDTIKNGYIIPFQTPPPPMFLKNNRSALDNVEFVQQAIADLLETGCIQKVPFQPFIVSPLSVAVNKSSGKKRLILDLSELNNFVEKKKVKFEDWNVALDFFTKDCYLFKFDLKSGYHHIDICSKQITYFAFRWEGHFYCFNVLVFGLTSAPYIFTKCLRPLVKLWRKTGIDIVLYLDDGFGFGRDFNQCLNASAFVQNSLIQAGFLINQEKSIFQPSQTMEWLGLLWDSKMFSLFIPSRRITELQHTLNFLINVFPSFTARELAKLAGQIISLSPVFGNVCSLMTRHLYLAIESRVHWDKFLNFEFPDMVRTELRFWSENLDNMNQRRLMTDFLPSVLVFSDASNVAAGAYTVEIDDKVVHQMWSKSQSLMSSTWRELKAVELALNSFAASLSGKAVRWHTDNQNCVKIVQKGSTKSHLQSLAFSIFSICIEYAISLDIVWIPREDNTKADYLSKIIDYDDWQTTIEFFQLIDSMWGPHTVDRFASAQNTKLKRYNSLFWYQTSESVDAFSQSWQLENNWLVPPINLVSRAIKHILLCRAHGTLIVPKWPSAAFWTMLFDENMKYREHVTDVLEFAPNQNVFCHGLNTRSLFGSDYFNSRVLAVRLSGEKS